MTSRLEMLKDESEMFVNKWVKTHTASGVAGL